MPTYGYALASALLWAISVPILNLGLQRLPQQAVGAMVPALLTSMTAGTVVLGVIAVPGGVMHPISAATILAGVFTYPVATGLYYLTGFAFGTRTEYAAQFAKVKPLFSVLIAVVVLGEAVSLVQALPLALMVGGIGLFYLGLSRHLYSRAAVTLGMLTALAWAIGEAFVKSGFTGSDTLDQAFVALFSGTALAWILYPLARAVGLRSVRLDVKWLWPFAAHGVISFGIAYTLFFHSVATLGLYSTVLLNAFWPFLSILVVKGLQYYRQGGPMQQVPINVWLASGLLLLASVTEIVLLNSV